MPIAFRGEIFYEYEHETLEELITHVGEGITGWVAEHRDLRPRRRTRGSSRSPSRSPTPTTSSNRCWPFPMTVGEAVQGVIVLSSLGYGAFDEEDQRLLEVLASHAADRHLQREAPPGRARGGGDLGGAPRICRSVSPSSGRSATSCRGRSRPSPRCIDARGGRVPRPRRAPGDFRLARLLTLDPGRDPARARDRRRPRVVAASVVFDNDEPFVIPRDVAAQQRRGTTSSSEEPRRGAGRAGDAGSPTGPGRSRVVGHEGDGVFTERGAPADPRRRRPHVARARQRAGGSPSSNGSMSSSRDWTRRSGRLTPDLVFTFVGGRRARSAGRRYGVVAGRARAPGARTSTSRIATRRWRGLAGARSRAAWARRSSIGCATPRRVARVDPRPDPRDREAAEARPRSCVG